ncbi:DsbA family protein, partial [Saccharospirillum mangrovi]
MIKLTLRPLALLVALALASLAAHADELTEADVEQLVHDYLLAHPEVVQEALDRLQQQQQAAQAAAEQQRLSSLNEQLVSYPHDPVGGNRDGELTLIEFFDYNCGYCKRANATLQALMEDNPNLRVVYKEFPILAETSVTAARASLALNKLYPEHYETFHRSLLERRSGLQKDDDVWDAIEELDGVDTAAIRAESQADWVQQTLASNYQLARQLNISGTPTFVIGDNMLRGA